jgi:GTP cyclohydrolase 1
MDKKKVEELVRELLVAFGKDPETPGLKETPRRVAGYWEELLEGEKYTNKEIAEKFSKSFEVGYDPIVTVYQDDIFSHCEHHLALMYDGNVIIGYIPVKNEDGTFKVLGLSKLYRIVDLCAKRLQLQEKLAADIAECISLATGSNQVYVNLTMKHGCVSARGSKSRGFTNVAYMTKELRANKQAREEFERKVSELITRR